MLRTVVIARCAAERIARLGAGLLAVEVGALTLLIAGVDGPALLLGRHQRAASAVDLAAARARGATVARRVGGGRAVWADGAVVVLLAVPPGVWPEVGADRVPNRWVRGLLRGLPAVGATRGAFYFGRDVVSARREDGSQAAVAVVSQDGTSAGGRLFEAVIAVGAPLALPAGIDRYPVHGDPRAAGPPPTCLAALRGGAPALDAVATAVIDGYAKVLARPATDGAVDEAEEPGPAIDEDEAGFASSGLADVPIGFVEALVRCADAGRIAAARLRGDFIAPGEVVAGLEASLAGSEATWPAVAARVDAAAARPGAVFHGLRELRVLAEAVLEAAGAGPGADPG